MVTPHNASSSCPNFSEITPQKIKINFSVTENRFLVIVIHTVYLQTFRKCTFNHTELTIL
jgi:hypothetical protein